MSNIGLVPALSNDGLSYYLNQINQLPLLTEEEELTYAQQLKQHNNQNAAKMLITSHLRLVVKIAVSFRNYGLPMYDLISEGNIGLMKAVKKFDPDKGFRLATYAMWWIKASMQEYILKSWSLVKIGTTATQKKLFFNLNKTKRLIGETNSDFSSKNIAEFLNVKEVEVKEMEQRLLGADLSLNNSVSDDNDCEIIDTLEDNASSQELIVGRQQEQLIRVTKFQEALSKLNAREQDILRQRRLADKPATLEDLSLQYNISKERVRQIEARTLEKLKELLS